MEKQKISFLKKAAAFATAAILLLSVPAISFATGQMTVTNETSVPLEDVPADGTGVQEPIEEGTPDEAAGDTGSVEISVQEMPAPETVNDINDSMFESATAVMLFDAVTGEEIYSKNPDAKVFPASTTKILSVLIAIEHGIQDKDITVAVCADDFSPDNSLMGLVRSETIPGIDLLYGMMLESGNDAAASVAVEIAGSMDAFSGLMNEKAAELGMSDSNFTNPSGIQNEQHYTTGNDMKKLVMHAYKNELLMQICGTKEYIIDPTDLCVEQRTMTNTNKLLITAPPKGGTAEDVEFIDYTYPYTTGMKTGYTYAANGCLVASAEYNGQAYIALIFNDTSELGVNRWDMATTLFNYAFTNYAKIYPAELMPEYTVSEQVRNYAKNDPESGIVTLTSGMQDFASDGVLVSKSEESAINNGELDITTNVSLSTILAAPMSEGQTVGTVTYYLGDKVLGSAPLVTTRRVYAEGEEELQSQTISESTAEYLRETDVMQEVGEDRKVLWWLLIPIGIIAFIVIRAFIISRHKAHMRRAAPVRQRSRVSMSVSGTRSSQKRRSRPARYRSRYK